MDIILTIIEAIMITWVAVLRRTLTSIVMVIILWSIYYYAIIERDWRHAIRTAIRITINLGVITMFFLISFLAKMIRDMPGQLGYAEIAVILGMILVVLGITRWWYRHRQI